MTTEHHDSLDDLPVTAEQLGAILGVTARWVREQAEAGTFPRLARGRYALGRSIRTYVASLKARERPTEVTDDKARLEKGRADRMELMVAEKRGQLRDVATVERAVEEFIRTERANLLALPAQFADTTAAELGVEVGLVLRVLEGMIRQHLTREAERAFTLAERLEGAA